MTLLESILAYNKDFVGNKEFENYTTSKKPDKKAVLFTCMDTRLQDLGTKALGFNNGDLKVVKNAGAIITHPYGSTIKSLLVGIYALGAEEIIIMAHKDCGMGCLDVSTVKDAMKERGVTKETFKIIEHSGVDVDSFLQGFKDAEENVRRNIDMVYNHPLFDKSVPIHGLVIDPHTGELDLIQDGYELAAQNK
ncbi:beta-class carbonic anhydrase [Staphylococcus carnosus]|uniref:beta-class carbonic anhydrase n=1 Tax=Staphylococcus carnosus TaxID=1281 RepID=UPI000CD07F98|nr:carbonic anhydrase [Staphylococcus carnosus]POA02745.1 carbonic anhydrase [Staphylococcus carnosus]QRQ04819.1 carbonic anhydrase [Staphylococcus carnosus]UTB83184.1 carbonic anhydrase [Staphylococcus carnosus]SUM05894.1 carbonic anhydrase [Staphylococcus carnosus]GEP79502.1 carbonic anhydrase [Staphylococcus carnosus]